MDTKIIIETNQVDVSNDGFISFNGHIRYTGVKAEYLNKLHKLLDIVFPGVVIEVAMPPSKEL